LIAPKWRFFLLDKRGDRRFLFLKQDSVTFLQNYTFMMGGDMMANMESAVSFVRQHGNIVEQTRLNVLIHQEVSLQSAVDELKKSQREDGSWAPFWAPEASSLDATCYRLAQCEQLGLESEEFIHKAIAFLVERQKADGSFEEDGNSMKKGFCRHFYMRIGWLRVCSMH
jgi:hypothetical protein